MFNTNVQTLSVVFGQLLCNNLGLADKNNRNLPSPGSLDGTINLMTGRIIPSHGVDSDYGAITQKKGPLFFYAKDILTLITAA